MARRNGGFIGPTVTAPTANAGANYGVAGGVWTLADIYEYKIAGTWPIPASAPNAPSITGVSQTTPTAAAVAFNASGTTGGLDVSSFTALASSGQSASATSSPITVTSLTTGNAVTFTVTATNAAGTSSASSASNSFTPKVPRGLFFGGGTNKYYNSEVNTIDYIAITTTGNATDFGDLYKARTWFSGCSSTTRAITMGGAENGNGGKSIVIDYVTMASTGNGTNFGNLSAARHGTGALSSATRGVCAGGDVDGTSTTDIMDYVTIANTGNATDFGNLTTARNAGPAGCASPTRGLFAGGLYNASSGSDAIDYITIASTGNASDFGDLNVTVNSGAGLSSETRGVFGRFYASAGNQGMIDTMDYVTIGSTGNATDFGNLAAATGGGAATSSALRGVFGTGIDASSNALNVMEYITIANTGNTTDFGDLTVARGRGAAASTDHGGLQ